ncbi:MAG: hypothetical protein QM719_10245 [Thermomonas sp.]
MNRYLAIGYALTVAIFIADLAVLRWIFPTPSANTLLVSQVLHLAFIPAAILLFIGTKRSVTLIRKIIGYSLSVLTGLAGISACVAVALILSGHVEAVAA